ncbi:MAG: arylsulfatase [Gammaproteobacteria bacterium]|nr:arylsulfatase [Gammaproteobacteria bacterium]
MKLWIVVCLTVMLGSCSSQPTQIERTQPNIVILFADDLGYGDLASYGHPYIRTPNLDDLAAEGQRWTDFYVAAPVCSPSRGALMTGKLPNRTGLYGRQINVMFPNDTVGMPYDEETLAESLKNQGYATAIIGKWHLGDAPDFYPTRHGFDYWYGSPYSNDMDWVGVRGFEELMTLAAQGKMAELQAEVTARQPKYFDPKLEYWNVPLIRSERNGKGFTDEIVERPTDQRTLTKRYTSEAIQFIERKKNDPFLLYVPYNMPHTPIFRSDAFVDKSLGGRYGDVIEELDWSVGKIVSKLEEIGLAKNTLVIFTSDNGPWRAMQHHGGSSGLLRDGKGTTFEGGMRVPAIFWWPDSIDPAVVSDIGSTLDIHATVLALAGTNATNTDGLDLTRTLKSRAPSPRQGLAYYRGGELRAFRKGPYKLHLVTEGAYNLPPKRTEHENPILYNLMDDPSEQFDIAAENPEVVAELLRALEEHQQGMTEQPPIFDQRLKVLQP